VRARLERLAQKRDSEHRLNVREALEQRSLAADYAALHGATTAKGVPVAWVQDGVYLSTIGDKEPAFVWLREMLSTLTFADVTADYAPTDEPPRSVRLIRVHRGYAIGSLLVVDADSDGDPDGLYHVWVAGGMRGKRIAAQLVEVARERFPITHVVGPLQTWRANVRAAMRLAPDLPIRCPA
jgi:GNAT superfamily N-acetyltransferase